MGGASFLSANCIFYQKSANEKRRRISIPVFIFAAGKGRITAKEPRSPRWIGGILLDASGLLVKIHKIAGLFLKGAV